MTSLRDRNGDDDDDDDGPVESMAWDCGGGLLGVLPPEAENAAANPNDTERLMRQARMTILMVYRKDRLMGLSPSKEKKKDKKRTQHKPTHPTRSKGHRTASYQSTTHQDDEDEKGDRTMTQLASLMSSFIISSVRPSPGRRKTHRPHRPCWSQRLESRTMEGNQQPKKKNNNNSSSNNKRVWSVAISCKK